MSQELIAAFNLHKLFDRMGRGEVGLDDVQKDVDEFLLRPAPLGAS